MIAAMTRPATPGRVDFELSARGTRRLTEKSICRPLTSSTSTTRLSVMPSTVDSHCAVAPTLPSRPEAQLTVAGESGPVMALASCSLVSAGEMSKSILVPSTLVTVDTASMVLVSVIVTSQLAVFPTSPTRGSLQTIDCGGVVAPANCSASFVCRSSGLTDGTPELPTLTDAEQPVRPATRIPRAASAVAPAESCVVFTNRSSVPSIADGGDTDSAAGLPAGKPPASGRLAGVSRTGAGLFA